MPEIDIEASASLTAPDALHAARLLELAELLDVDPCGLDEAVHHAASVYASDACNSSGAVDDPDAGEEVHEDASRQAAEVNNGGLGVQVPYLVAQYGATEAERLIREAAEAG